jgi:O-antigen/teichoic acid export membrane protein
VEDKRKIGRDSTYVLAGKGVLMGLTVAFAAVVPKALGPRGTGHYAFFFSLLFLGIAFLDMGGGMILRRYLPGLQQTSPSQMAPLARTTLILKLPLAAVMALVSLAHPQRAILLILTGGALAASVGETVSAVCYGCRRMRLYLAYPIATAVLRLALTVPLYRLWGSLGLAAAMSCAPALAAMVVAIPALGSLPKGERLDRPYPRYMGFGLLAFWGDFFHVTINRVAIVLSKLYLGDLQIVGYLGVAFMVYLFARHVSYALGETALPALVRCHVSGGERQFRQVLNHVWRYTNVLVFLEVVVLAGFPRALLTLVLGDAFAPAAPYVAALVPGTVLVTWLLFYRLILFAHERKRDIFFAHLFNLASFILLLAILLPLVGGLGTVLAFSAAMLPGFLYCRAKARALVREPASERGVWIPLAASVLAVVAARAGGAAGTVGFFLPISVAAYVLLLVAGGWLNLADWRRLSVVFGREAPQPKERTGLD